VVGIMMILMGVVVNYLFVFVIGLGFNVFVIFGVVKLFGMMWVDVMGLVVFEGLIVFVLVFIGFW